MKIILISACLAGQYCRFDGGTHGRKCLEVLKAEAILPVCPEQLGNLPVPREPAEIVDGTGNNVLQGKAKVFTKKGGNVTRQFLDGAEKVLAIARENKVRCAIFKERSPSCGCKYVYDGSFSGRLLRGSGVTTALLRQNGISVFSDEDLLAARSLKKVLGEKY